MKSILLLILLLLAIMPIYGQEVSSTSRIRILDFHVGAGFSNFLNAEAPHKTFLFLSSDEYYLTLDPASLGRNYSTSLTKDIRYSVTFGVGFEYELEKSWALFVALNYEGKGINLEDRYSHHQEHWGLDPNTGEQVLFSESLTEESTKVEVSNNYLAMPILLRKYLTVNRVFYLQGGFYMAYLLKSEGKIELFDAYGSTLGDNNFSSMSIIIDDKDKIHTAKFDYGLSLGTGITKTLTNNLYLKADLLVNIGLRSVDSLYDNEYEEAAIGGATGFNNAVKSNNYYGLNSDAKNINVALTIGVGIQL